MESEYVSVHREFDRNANIFASCLATNDFKRAPNGESIQMCIHMYVKLVSTLPPIRTHSSTGCSTQADQLLIRQADGQRVHYNTARVIMMRIRAGLLRRLPLNPLLTISSTLFVLRRQESRQSKEKARTARKSCHDGRFWCVFLQDRIC